MPEEKPLRYHFPRTERLRSKKQIEELFSKGSSFYLYPFRVVFLYAEETPDTMPQFLVSVSKRNFKKATDRNKIKRRIKEAYRLNKHRLKTDSQGRKPTLLAYIYTAKQILDFHTIEEKLTASFSRLTD